MNIVKKLKQLFASYPKVDKFYLTSDGQAFTRDDMASAHANDLKDKKYQSYTKDSIAALEKSSKNKTAADAGKNGEVEHVVTQEMLDLNPELVEEGVKVGDTFSIPAPVKEKEVKAAPKKPAAPKPEKASKTAKEKAAKIAAEKVVDPKQKTEVSEPVKPVELTESVTSNTK